MTKKNNHTMQILNLPESMRPAINVTYPPHNHVLFEEFFHRYLEETKPDLGLTYIPIYWTAVYVNRDYGHGDLSDVQRLIDGLDRTKRYFTVVQYDDNILNDLSGIDVTVLAMGGYGKWRDKCYPVPLNCQPPQGLTKSDRKDVFASFVGSPTHRIRSMLAMQLGGNPKYAIRTSPGGYDEFRSLMSRSRFSICPRGYGQTSFRICEALQAGSIPVYIYDDPLFPFGDILPFEEYGVAVHVSRMHELDSILSSISDDEFARLTKRGEEVYSQFYDYTGAASTIVSVIKKKGDGIGLP